jgi:hypothetical protein
MFDPAFAPIHPHIFVFNPNTWDPELAPRSRREIFTGHPVVVKSLERLSFSFEPIRFLYPSSIVKRPL